LRAGYYLCFFGIHALTPLVMDVLAELAARDRSRPLDLTSALAELARRERYLALEVAGQRYNIGLKYGLLTAQLALALDGVDRERILAQIIDLLAHRGTPD
jgi:UTP--glucose-1-phosphate uridylyltransferase